MSIYEAIETNDSRRHLQLRSPITLEPCGELVQAGLEAGVLINVTRNDTIRLLPPLTLSDAEADQLVALVSGLVSA